MKKWFSHLIGNPDSAGRSAGAGGAPDDAAGDVATEQIGSEIDAAYYRLLTASAGFQATREVEQRILADVQALVGQPGTAAGWCRGCRV